MSGEDLDLSALLGSSGPSDERVDRVLRSVPTPPMALRVLLAVVVAVQAPIVLTWLLNSDPLGVLGEAHDVHLVRDGAFGFVILSAAAITVWRPRWAVPSFAISSLALLAQLAAGFADDSISASAWNEAFHLVLVVTTLLVGACGLWLRPMSTTAPSRATPVDEAEVIALDQRAARR